MSGQHQQRDQNRDQDQSAANVRHSIAVTQSINATMQSIVGGDEAEDRSQYQERRECIWGGFRHSAGPECQWKRHRQCSARPTLAARVGRLRIFWSLNFHLKGSSAPATCLRLDSPARGSFAMLFASFTLVGWVLLRGLA
jgi:hypothetical protein